MSLENTGVIEKANKAKQNSDTASLKEYVSVLEAEYELMSEAEKASKTSTEYVNSKLAEKGYKRRVNEDGILLMENAVAAIEDGIEIGQKVNYIITTVQNYTPDSTKTGTTNSELETQTNLTWIYVGLSDEGELLISPDVSSGAPSNSSVALNGVAGWLTGPSELDIVCDKLYSIAGKGKARNMNLDDVCRILGYTGEKGGYYESTNGNYVPTDEPMTIAELESKYSTLSPRKTPTKPTGENSDLGEYKSDYYYISKKVSDDVKAMSNSENIKYVYPGNESYWLASSCVRANFKGVFAAFCVNYVNTIFVNANAVMYNSGAGNKCSASVRPVVVLLSDLQKVEQDDEVTWNI